MEEVREQRDFYNANGVPNGQTYFKGDPIPDGMYVMVVMIAIQNSKGKFLYQKRSKRKGGNWGVTGGHPKHGETPKQGIITEVFEEIGIDILNEKIEVIKKGRDDTHCYVMYYVKMDLDTKKLVLQKSEVSRVKWFSLQKLEKMKKQGKLSVNQIAFLDKLKIFLEKKQINN